VPALDAIVYAAEIRRAMCETFIDLENMWIGMQMMSGRGDGEDMPMQDIF
jgi:hypothetical protein